MKHTKGPWKVEHHEIKNRIRPLTEIWNQNTFIASVESETFCVAEINGEKQANAQLIAAAPDMLELLEMLRRELTLQGKKANPVWLRMIDDTIRTAKGGR